jgi:PAS domain-containing protein
VSTVNTYFAPAERADEPAVAADYRRLSAEPLIPELLNSFPEPVMVLNRERQVVFANDKLLAALNRPLHQVIGLRPGEVFSCVHGLEQAGGCGTTKFCSQCGAARAIINSAATGLAQSEECRMACSSETGLRALDLRVWATPLAYDRRLTVFAVRDITDEKRRAVLERLFFHDVLNAAGGLKGIIDMWPDLSHEETTEMGDMASNLANELIEEIRSHRDLVAAERGDLTVTLKTFDVKPLLLRLCLLYGSYTVATGKRLAPPELVGPTLIHSDEVLLSRVLGNLLNLNYAHNQRSECMLHSADVTRG